MDITEFDIEFLSLKLSENPLSPLFARLADIYLEKNQTVEALKLCEEGTKIFPQYYAGYFILGKAHLALKEYSKARAAFNRVKELSPFNPAVSKMIASIPDS
ncbi:MAG: tetratricopeptide repeat protein, partial [Bacteroidota bacterium]|nr:tetratricopeptide repeat protein [Bacteroidota bacterium]